jgi:hypothetical protein
MTNADAAADTIDRTSDDEAGRASRRSQLDKWITASTADWSTRIAAVRSSRSAWPALYVGVFVAQAMMLLVAGRSQWYFFDEWRLIVERVVAPGDVNLFERLFRPDGEHVIAVPLALFVLLAKVGGLDSYWPFVFANIVVRLATMWVADDIVRRMGGRRVARLMVLVSIAFFGEGYESLFGQSLIFAGLTLVFSLLALREAVRDDVSRFRATALSTAFLVAAVFSTSYAFPVVLAVALILLLTRGALPALVSLLVPPACFLVVRALAGGAYSEQQAISLRFGGAYIDYVQVGLTSVGEAVTGLIGLGIASFVGLVVVSLLLSTERRSLVLAAAATLAVVAFFGQASLSRSALGASQAASTRYLFFCGILVLVMLGAAWGTRRVTPRGAGVVAVLFVVSLSNNVGRLIDGYDFFIPKMQLSQDRLSVGFVVQDDFPDFVPDPDWAPDLRLDRLDSVVAWSGSAGLIEDGRACVGEWTEELDAVGLEPESRSDSEVAALVLLLNEHASGTGVAGASIGDLVRFAAAGGTGSTVLDQLSSVYAEVAEDLDDSSAVPDLDHC